MLRTDAVIEAFAICYFKVLTIFNKIDGRHSLNNRSWSDLLGSALTKYANLLTQFVNVLPHPGAAPQRYFDPYDIIVVEMLTVVFSYAIWLSSWSLTYSNKQSIQASAHTVLFYFGCITITPDCSLIEFVPSKQGNFFTRRELRPSLCMAAFSQLDPQQT